VIKWLADLEQPPLRQTKRCRRMGDIHAP
jgi:hypothetical protein